MFAQNLEAGSRIPFMTENILVVTELVSVVTRCHAFLCLLFNPLNTKLYSLKVLFRLVPPSFTCISTSARS